MSAERDDSGSPPDEDRCAYCGVPGAPYRRWTADYSFAYALCRDCHREVRSWSPRERGPRPDARSVPLAVRERVIP